MSEACFEMLQLYHHFYVDKAQNFKGHIKETVVWLVHRWMWCLPVVTDNKG